MIVTDSKPTPLPLYDERPLPAGWLKRVDERTNCPFYVDTLGLPPHSIWVHPLDDPDYLRKTGQIYPDQVDAAPPDYTLGEKIPPPHEDDPNAASAELAPPPELPPASSSTSVPGPSKGIFSKFKGKSQAAPTPAEIEAKRESEAKAYFAQREVMLAKRKEESSEADFARLLTRPYTTPLPSHYGGPKYKPPVHKSFGKKMSGFADGAFNLVFGSNWPEKHGLERGSW